ncbi:MAG: NfeD family protein [Bacillaceae bacterium]
MLNFYLFCFMLGVIYVVVMLIVGDILDLSFLHIPFLSSTTLLSFLVSFGATGLYLEQMYNFPLYKDLALSIIVGAIVFFLIFFLVALPLQRSEKSAAKSIQDMVGLIATVTVPCEGDKIGEIVYSQNQFRLNGPCKSSTKEEIKQGDSVRITRIEDGIFYIVKE